MVTSHFKWKSLLSTPLWMAEGACVECAETERDRALDLGPPATLCPGLVGVTLSGRSLCSPRRPGLSRPALLQPPHGSPGLRALVSVTGLVHGVSSLLRATKDDVQGGVLCPDRRLQLLKEGATLHWTGAN